MPTQPSKQPNSKKSNPRPSTHSTREDDDEAPSCDVPETDPVVIRAVDNFAYRLRMAAAIRHGTLTFRAPPLFCFALLLCVSGAIY